MTTRTALVTGASRGLGRALADRARRPRLAARRRRPGRRPAGRHRRRAAPAPTSSPPSPATSPTPPTGAALAAAVGAAARPAGQQRQRARPEPAAAARRPAARRPPARPRRQRRRAARARAGRPPGAARAPRGAVVDISSDAAVEAYEGWGGYGASKAALDQLTAVLAVEHPELRVYAVDPGDMATDMHQAAFPGEDISDRPDAGDRRPRPAGAGRRRPAQRPVPRRRPGAGGGGPMTATFTLPAGAEATAPPEWRGLRARRGAADGRRARGRRGRRGSATSPTCSSPATSSSSTPRPRCPAGSTPGGRTAWSCRCTGRRTLDDGDWVVELRRPGQHRARPRRRARHRARAARRGRGHPARRPPRPGPALPAVARPHRLRRADDRRTCARTAGADRLRLPRGDFPLADYQNVYADRAGQRGDGQRRPAVHRARSSSR